MPKAEEPNPLLPGSTEYFLWKIKQHQACQQDPIVEWLSSNGAGYSLSSLVAKLQACGRTGVFHVCRWMCMYVCVCVTVCLIFYLSLSTLLVQCCRFSMPFIKTFWAFFRVISVAVAPHITRSGWIVRMLLQPLPMALHAWSTSWMMCLPATSAPPSTTTTSACITTTCVTTCAASCATICTSTCTLALLLVLLVD